MRVRQLVSSTTLFLVLVMIVAACGKKVPPPPPQPPAPPPPAVAPPPPPPPPPPPAPAPAPPPRALTEDEIFQQKTLAQLNAEMPLGDVRFDYDQFTLSAEARAILQKNSDWMKRWTTTRVSIEGHCDSRGTNEYNLALGERRANAVKEYMVGLGIAADRLLVVSKGEETPVCSEESEACWAQNRRGHNIITAK